MPAGATYEPIATTTVTGSNAANITFNSISSSYTDLVLIMFLQSDRATNGSVSIRLEFNGDTAGNYSSFYLYGNGTSAVTNYSGSTAPLTQVGEAPGGPTLPVFGFSKVSIFSYTNSTYKTILSEWAADRNGSGFSGRTVGKWNSTAAINSIKITLSGQNIVVGSTATLYGIKAA